MNRNTHLPSRLLTVAALAFALALPVAGQVSEERSWNRDRSRSAESGATKVIAVQVWADPFGSGRARRYGVAPENEAVQVVPGERLRLTLVGTGLFDGEGEEVPVGASFNLEAGRDVSILRTGSNWVEVAIGDDARGVAGQVGYRTRGGYDMRGALTSGRITLEAKRSGGGDPNNGYGGRDETGTRRETSRVVTRALIEGILNATFDPSRDGERVDEIYEEGYPGVRRFADELALSVERRRIALDPEVTVRRLYRVLLKRSNDQIESDRGYWNNVKALRIDGLRSVVQTLVDSAEFRKAFHLDNFEPLEGRRRY